jgi:hypothetical protein
VKRPKRNKPNWYQDREKEGSRPVVLTPEGKQKRREFDASWRQYVYNLLRSERETR